MNPSFQPFARTPAKPRPSNQPIRLAILPQPEADLSTFAPPPDLAPPPQPVAPTPPPQTAPVAEPQIAIDRDGDRISRVTIRCPCGHVIELLCTS